MEPQDLQLATWRGVPFFVSTTKTRGGRRVVTKLFPNSDRQSVEDLGLRPREFTLSGRVSARRDRSGNVIQSYQVVRDALLRALEQRGVGVLVHPFFGRLESVNVSTYVFDQDIRQLGDTPIEITFVVNEGLPTPQVAESVVGSVSSQVSVVSDQVEQELGEDIEVTDSFLGNFVDMAEKIVDVAEAFRSAVRSTADASDEVTDWQRRVNDLSDTAIQLVSDSPEMADQIRGLMDDIGDLYESKDDTLRALEQLFIFGESDIPIDPFTVGLTQRKSNRDLLNNGVQAFALAQAYFAAVQLDLQTVDDVNRVSALLEDQYQKMQSNSTITSDTLAELTQLRVSANRFFDQQRDLRPQVLEVKTNLTSSRLLAFDYYGSSEQGDTLALLNGAQDPALLEGTVRILTQ